MAYIELEDTTSAEKMRLENTTKVFETTGIYNKMNVYLNANCYRSFWNMQNLQSIPSFLKFDKVTNMQEMFIYDNKISLNLQNISFNNAVDMFRTFFNCFNIIGSPVCGNKVTNFAEAYARCYNLTGNPACGANVVNMSQTYYECHNLNGPAVCSPTVTNMCYGYYNCYNISSAVFGKGLASYYNVNYAYQFCNNIRSVYVDMPNAYRIGYTGYTYSAFYNTNLSKVTNITFGPNCTIAYQTFLQSATLTNTVNIIIGNNVINMIGTFDTCTQMKGHPACGPNVVNMWQAYSQCENLTGSPVTSQKVIDLGYAYHNCKNITGSAVCPATVINLQFAYANCYNINAAVFGRGIPNSQMINNAYAYCNNIKSIYIDMPNAYLAVAGSGSPLSFYGANLSKVTNITFGPNCTTMYRTCYYQSTLTNTVTIIVDNNVTNMRAAFHGCTQMKGSPVCGPNVTDMSQTYQECENLTGSPICGPKVTDISYAYWNCKNLTGSAVCPSTVTDLQYAYANCYNIDAAVFGRGISNYQKANYAYQFCNNIRSIYIDMSNAHWVGRGHVVYMPFNNTNLSKVTNITFGDNCTIASSCFYGATTLTNNINVTLGNNLTNITQLFDGCTPLQCQVTGGANIVDMSYAFRSCQILKMAPFCGSKVTNMFWTYGYCYNLTGSPVCGPAVTNMNAAYYDCRNISGNIIIGPLVTDLNNTFFNCTKISTIVIPNATKSMTYTYLQNICNRGTYNTTRLNVIVENNSTYTALRGNGIYCFGATFTADAAHATTFTVNSQTFTTVRYAYNATRNIYLYCLT